MESFTKIVQKTEALAVSRSVPHLFHLVTDASAALHPLLRLFSTHTSDKSRAERCESEKTCKTQCVACHRKQFEEALSILHKYFLHLLAVKQNILVNIFELFMTKSYYVHYYLVAQIFYEIRSYKFKFAEIKKICIVSIGDISGIFRRFL